MNVEFYETEGINDHILGYLIKRTYHTVVIMLANSFNFETYCAHTYIGDKC